MLVKRSLPPNAVPHILVLERIHENALRLMAGFAKVTVRLDLSRGEILQHVYAADAIVVRSVVEVDEALLAAAPDLKVVARAGTGIDNIDVAATTHRGVTVVTAAGANAMSTADFAVAQILCLIRNLYAARDAVQERDFRRHRLEGRQLSCLSVGIVGFGRVGRHVATRLAGFGCRILAYDPGSPEIAPGNLPVERPKTLEMLLPEVDVLTLHAALTPQSRGIVGERALRMVKPGLLLVNSARAALLDDAALLDALDDGRVGCAALDLIDPEPPFDAAPDGRSYEHRLLTHPKVIYTPHMAASTVDAQAEIGRSLAIAVRRAFAHLAAPTEPVS